jgi:hypothetical protein
MPDKLVLTIGNWVTLRAEGGYALAAATAFILFFGAMWFAVWWVSSGRDKNFRSKAS